MSNSNFKIIAQRNKTLNMPPRSTVALDWCHLTDYVDKRATNNEGVIAKSASEPNGS